MSVPTELRELLAELYYTNDLALDIAKRAGIKRSRIDATGSSFSTWGSILDEADNQLQLEGLLAEVKREYPKQAEAIDKAARGVPAHPAQPAIVWAPTKPEVIIGANDSFPIEFLETTARLARSVVRVALDDGRSGTGFLIADDLVLTNHHVLPTRASAGSAFVEIGYDQTLLGIAKPGTSRKTIVTDAKGYIAGADRDWAVVRVEPTGIAPIPLDVVATVVAGERVFIIQHPGGGPKKIALGENLVTAADDMHVQYLTDTMPGSSGSPVFDRKCRLVALHHAGGWGDQPGQQTERLRNEGMTIAGVIAGIKAREGEL